MWSVHGQSAAQVVYLLDLCTDCLCCCALTVCVVMHWLSVLYHCHDGSVVRLGIYLGSRRPRNHRLIGLVFKASSSRAEDPGFESCLLQGRVMPVTWKLALQWLPWEAPGIIGSVLGLVSPVSVFCDWVRQKVWSATSVSVWQHENCLSRSVPEIHSHVAGTLKQPTNKNQDPGITPCSSLISHTSDLKMDTLLATFPDR